MDAESEERFREFVRTRSATLLGTAYALTGHQQAAEDLLQNALAKTATQWRRVHTSPEAYVRRVMYNDQVSWWRRLRVREEQLDVLPEIADPRDHAGQTALRVALREALRQLAPGHRAVLVLRFLEDYSEAETARLLGVSPGTVASQVHRALARLRVLAPSLSSVLTNQAASDIPASRSRVRTRPARPAAVPAQPVPAVPQEVLR